MATAAAMAVFAIRDLDGVKHENARLALQPQLDPTRWGKDKVRVTLARKKWL
jgi:hypothetical protein